MDYAVPVLALSRVGDRR